MAKVATPTTEAQRVNPRLCGEPIVAASLEWGPLHFDLDVVLSNISKAKSANSYSSHHISWLFQPKLAGIVVLVDLNSK